MKLCKTNCIPCCDHCKHAIHDRWQDNNVYHVGGAIDCELHRDEEHKIIAQSSGYCDDFCCFNAETDR